jgi:hypothetical protein
MTEPVRMLFVGDIALSGEYLTRYGAISQKWAEPFKEIAPIFMEASIRVGSLESPLSIRSTQQNKRNLLWTPPSAVEALSFIGLTVLSLATNHITDQGLEGITKTRELLDSRKISHFGAGENLATASQPAIITSQGLSFAFLGYAAEQSEVGAYAATESREGCPPLSLDRIEHDIKSIRNNVSHIVVSLHWGYQFDLYPEPEQIKIARKIIDLGALIVYGHHPHVIQGMERYRNGLILYSLGNFFFPDFKRTGGCWFHFPEESKRTAIAQCEVGAEGVRSASWLPLLVDPNYRIRILSMKSAILARKEFDSRSAALHVSGYHELWSIHHKKTAAWRKRTERRLRFFDEATACWSRIRTLGLAASLTRIRTRHLIAIFRIARRFCKRNQS